LQSLSTPLQLASFAAGVPGLQLSTMVPPEHDVAPVEEQAPTPQDVATDT
jgi:hypothetical protein